MATYPLFTQATNNLERRYNAKTFNVNAVIAKGDGIRSGDTLITAEDTLFIGTIPGGSLVKGMEVLVNEAFDGGTTSTFSFFFTADYPEKALTTITTGVDVSATNANKTIHIDLPTSGVVNGNSIWLGDSGKTGDYYIVAAYTGTGTAPTGGDIDVLMSYDRFVTNVGAY